MLVSILALSSPSRVPNADPTGANCASCSGTFALVCNHVPPVCNDVGETGGGAGGVAQDRVLTVRQRTCRTHVVSRVQSFVSHAASDSRGPYYGSGGGMIRRARNIISSLFHGQRKGRWTKQTLSQEHFFFNNWARQSNQSRGSRAWLALPVRLVRVGGGIRASCQMVPSLALANAYAPETVHSNDFQICVPSFQPPGKLSHASQIPVSSVTVPDPIRSDQIRKSREQDTGPQVTGW